LNKNMTLFESIRARRSIRRYTDETVPVDVLEAIITAGLAAPTGCNAQLRGYIIVTDPAVMDQLRPVSKALATAPAAIVQLIEPKATRYGEFYLQDAAASIENMLLAAVATGYASCWVEGAVRHSHDDVRRILGVPTDVNVSAILPIGKPAESPPPPKKATIGQAVHYNRFGRRRP